MSTTNQLFFVACYRDGMNADVDLSAPKVINIPRDSVKKVTPVATGKKGSIIHVLDPSNRQWKQYRVYETPAEVHAAMNPDSTDPYAAPNLQLGVDAAGATQGAGTALTKYFVTVDAATATSAEAIVLPAAVANKHIQITNLTAVTLKLFPASGDKINDGTVDTSIDIAPMTRKHLYAKDGTNWYTITDANV